jgi:hypothetical protein
MHAASLHLPLPFGGLPPPLSLAFGPSTICMSEQLFASTLNGTSIFLLQYVLGPHPKD